MLGGIPGCAEPRSSTTEIHAAALPAKTVTALNALRDDLDARYGFREGTPRINLGPCGRFARDFRVEWNARFPDPATIVFVMSNNGLNCHHVLIRLPDGHFYDGGCGVMTKAALLKIFPNSRVEEMKEFDFNLLDKRSYGLGRSYPECSNYSDDFTREMIRKRLDSIRAPAARGQSRRPLAVCA